MFLDVFVATILAVITFRITYEGTRMTLRPVEDEKEKRKLKREFIVLGAVSVALIVFQAYRGAKAYSDLEALIGKNERPSVGMSALQTWPPVQVLDPNKPFLVGMGFTVSEGTARAMQCWIDAFTVAGEESDDQNRAARIRFRQENDSEAEPQAIDHVKGTSCYKGVNVSISEDEINEIVGQKRTVYAMGRVVWRNDAGAEFSTDVCAWMEPQKSRVVSNPGWHDCSK